MFAPSKFWCPKTKPTVTGHNSAYRLVLRIKNDSWKNPCTVIDMQ